MDRLAVMKAFVRVLEAGSFSAAAKQLSIGQPSVSKSISHLESRLGVRLLTRSTRRLVPTEAGRAFYEHALRAVEAADRADSVALEAGSSLCGRLRVSAAVSLASLHIVPRLPSFLSEHPNMSVDLVLDDRSIDLIGEGIDLALRLGRLRDCSLTARKLTTGHHLVLGAPAYFDRAGVPARPADLIAHTTISYADSNSCDAWTFRQDTSELSIKLSSRVRMTATEGVRAAVLSGAGLAIGPDWMFMQELSSGAVRAVLTDWTLPPSDIWAVFPTGRLISPKVRAFANFVEAQLRRVRWKLDSPPHSIPQENDAYDRLTTPRVRAAV